ncbi:MAG: hypothetical protein MJ150_03275 [Clostridia bacterium]|nr:hypothetical protein [Clostridia bacterium]
MMHNQFGDIGQKVGEKAAESGIDIVIAFGSKREWYKKGFAGGRGIFIGCETLEEAKGLVLQTLKKGDAVLVKGSNSTKVSEVAIAIREKYN